jgi:hypothetical protein
VGVESEARIEKIIFDTSTSKIQSKELNTNSYGYQYVLCDFINVFK